MLNKIYWETENAVDMACSILVNGGIIVYPTDTLYGFGCDGKNESAIQKINHIKGRSAPMSVLAPDKDVASQWLDLDKNEKMKCLDLLGEQTTIIAPVKVGIVSPNIMGNNLTLGIRIPNHDFCKLLSNAYPNPITSTSVNRTGDSPLTDPDQICKVFESEIDLVVEDQIIDGDGSTIYLYHKGELKILRS